MNCFVCSFNTSCWYRCCTSCGLPKGSTSILAAAFPLATMVAMMLLILLTVLSSAQAFLSQTPRTLSHSLLHMSDAEKSGGIFQGVKNFWAELDAFMDDASARRLGNGAAFYGKRKSNFYGNNDKNKKQSSEFDAAEDYFGPSAAGYFQWMPDADGKLRPVTRMKKQVVEKRRRQRKDGSNS